MSNQESRYSRKTFLRLGLAGSGALLLGGSVCILNRSGRELPKSLFFSKSELDILAALAEAILPEGPGLPSYKEAQVLERLDEEFYFVDPFLSDDFKTLVLVIEYLPFFHWKFSRFSRLPLESRREFLTSLNNSDSDLVRAVWANLRMPIFLMYYGHSSTFKAISYDGPFSDPPEKLSESRIYYRKLVGGSDVG
ncbi:hypothetical protein ACE5IS_09580 [Leptospira wolffii]|uniref:Gluconate 2-dehydrogenase subunit 3 family protein n=1 Tax=Leptospira wolffii TaxID=409998 RepID=A0ABV5BN71_9LEPT|nr:hypothetical protein [Leptospira wolffii]EPG65324.1 hypothetical protein LEP1GSC061_2658 [Leptospira wolffii serovar Khorat str. Khorat-H2]TGL52592.1 hypothetical protein EHQ61_05880 [Leptospira wolffii]